MYQFARLPSLSLFYSAEDDQTLLWPGFPIRKSAGQRLFSASPRLIAAVHVLHRLLVPRHPPCALSILTENTHYFIATMQISRCAQGSALPAGKTALLHARSFKTEQRRLWSERSGAPRTRSTYFQVSASATSHRRRSDDEVA